MSAINIIYKSRNYTIKDNLRDRIEEKISTLSKFDPTIRQVEVEIIKENNDSRGDKDHKANISVTGKGKFQRAETASFSAEAAFDESFEVVKRAIRKARDKMISSKR